MITPRVFTQEPVGTDDPQPGDLIIIGDQVSIVNGSHQRIELVQKPTTIDEDALFRRLVKRLESKKKSETKR